MARRNGTLKLERLLIYSEIYNLKLTDADIKHLQTVFDTYKDKVNYEYIYKPATEGYDIIMSSSIGDVDPYILIQPRPRTAPDTTTYPLFSFASAEWIGFNFLPDVKELGFVEEAAKLLGLMLRNVDNAALRLVSSVDELKEKVLKYIRDFTPDYYHAVSAETISTLYKCAGQPVPNLVLTKGKYDYMPEYVRHIVGVIQLPVTDTRLAFYVLKRKHAYYYNNGYELALGFYITEVGDPTYNWTDPDRYFSHQETAGVYYEHKPRVFYIDKLPILPSNKEVIDAQRRGRGVLTLDNPTLDTITKRWTRKQQDLANEKVAIQQLEKKLAAKIDALDKGGEFSYNDLTFRKNEFEYEGQTLSCTDVLMKDVLASFSGSYSEDHLNFDRVLDVWMKKVTTLALNSAAPISGKIGDVSFTVRHVQKKAKNNVVNHLYYVNERRINKDEVPDVLGRAICFPDTASFEEFCDTVAKCSLRYHKYLSGGIFINAHDEIFNQRVEFQISLERQKNKNFVVFNGKKFKVSNTNKLLSIVNAGSMSRIIDVLLDPDVAGLGGDDMKQLIEVGRQTLIEQRKRESELLSNTMDMFGITMMEEFTAQNGRAISGYLIKGTLRDYIVDANNLLVYEYPTGRYICMVDKGQNEHTNTARLVNRFFALSNDSKLAKEITTL